MLRLCKQCHAHFGDESSCPHCGAPASNPLGRAVRTAAAAVTAAAVLSGCSGVEPRPLYGVALQCTKDSDCAQTQTCNTQTHQCVLKPDAGP
jgi:hypothetical protein